MPFCTTCCVRWVRCLWLCSSPFPTSLARATSSIHVLFSFWVSFQNQSMLAMLKWIPSHWRWKKVRLALFHQPLNNKSIFKERTGTDAFGVLWTGWTFSTRRRVFSWRTTSCSNEGVTIIPRPLRQPPISRRKESLLWRSIIIDCPSTAQCVGIQIWTE